MNDFDTLLRLYRERRGISRNMLANLVGVDPSYLTRIENGDRGVPRQHIVEALGNELRLTREEWSYFMTSAGYAPHVLSEVGGWDPALQAVSDVLRNRFINKKDREQFREMILNIARLYQRASEVEEEEHETWLAPVYSAKLVPQPSHTTRPA